MVRTAVALLFSALSISLPVGQLAAAERAQTTPVNPHAQALVEFKKRVDAYLERVMQGQAQPISVPAPIQAVLMAKYDSKVYPAGIDRAVQRAQRIRATADSTRAANQPPSQVPLPTPPAPGGRPDSSAGTKRP